MPRQTCCPAWRNERRRGADKQQLTQPFIAGLADLAHPLLAAGGMFLWRQPQPGGEMSAGFKVVRLHRQGHGDRGNRASAWDLGQQLAQLKSVS
jgi:hypothetical protein